MNLPKSTKSLAASALLGLAGTEAGSALADSISIQPNGAVPSMQGMGAYFTGDVRVDPLFQAVDPARASGALVNFEPGARTLWHDHPLGQILIVTEGVGLVQEWGGEIREIKTGDVVHIPANTKHWHGAAESTAMSHIAIQEALDGRNVEWMEPVTDQQYGDR